MIIPWQWNDGFSKPYVIDRVYGFFRPILHEARKDAQLLAMMRQEDDLHDLLLQPPNFFGEIPKDPEDRKQLVTFIFGDAAQEQQLWDDVAAAAEMYVKFPNFATLPCDICRQFVVDEETGTLRTDMGGRYLPRVLPTPCEQESGWCVKGHHQQPVEPSEVGSQAWEHYWAVKAAKLPVTCPIMARNFATIEWIVHHGRAAEFNPFPRRTAAGTTPYAVRDGLARPEVGGGGSEPSGELPVADVRGAPGADDTDASAGAGTADSEAEPATDPNVGGGQDTAVQCEAPDSNGTGEGTPPGSDYLRLAPGSCRTGDGEPQPAAASEGSGGGISADD